MHVGFLLALHAERGVRAMTGDTVTTHALRRHVRLIRAAPTHPRKEQHMNPNKALWEKGDFTRIAATMRESGEAFAKTLDIAPGIKVLDVGCGDGTTALPQAQLGAARSGPTCERGCTAGQPRPDTAAHHGARPCACARQAHTCVE